MAVTAREVTFTGANRVRLAGTLTLPFGAKPPVPGLVLIAGSGPTDRDGNQGDVLKTDLLRQVADILADAGVAALRYDKRGVGGSQKIPTNSADWEAFAAWEGFVGDAEAGLAWLRQQKEIDAARCGFLGHSEGGTIALHAADRAKGTPRLPAALVLAATPGRPSDVIVREQLARLLKLQQATPEQTRFFLDRNDAIVATIRKTGKVPPDVPAGLAALYPPYLGRFYRSELALQPAEMAAQYIGPVLLLQGTADVQISPDRDARALYAALKRRKPDAHELVVIPKASHNLKLVSSEADPGFAGPVAPAVAASLRAWIPANLTASKPRPVG